MPFKGKAMRTKRILPRIHASIRKKFSETAAADWTGYSGTPVENGQHLHTCAADTLQVFARDISNEEGDNGLHGP
jgi:hypothetical protein